jgi:hypothetical protein
MGAFTGNHGTMFKSGSVSFGLVWTGSVRFSEVYGRDDWVLSLLSPCCLLAVSLLSPGSLLVVGLFGRGQRMRVVLAAGTEAPSMTSLVRGAGHDVSGDFDSSWCRHCRQCRTMDGCAVSEQLTIRSIETQQY